jgi:crotonobetainyl-CoA:carnitine CoA-transferase CaiB-like acyl-CoA transferase
VSLPLAGITVIDLTQLLPGPLATRHLMEWGAHVVKVEPPGIGDGSRVMYLTEEDRALHRPSGFFRDLNAGKETLRLDLRSESGKAELLDRVRLADVVIEGFCGHRVWPGGPLCAEGRTRHQLHRTVGCARPDRFAARRGR